MRVTRILTVGSLTLAMLAAAAPAQAAPADTLAAAYDRLVAEADSGLDVISTVTSSRESKLNGLITAGAIPARTPVVVRTAFDGAGASVQSVKLRRGTAVGIRGANATNGMFSSISMMPGGFDAFATGRAITPATTITGLDARMVHIGTAPIDLSAALTFLLPPTAGTADVDWRGIREGRGPGGVTVITAASGPGPDGDTCTYPKIRVTIVKGRLSTTDWTAQCNGVRTRYQSTVQRKVSVTGATAPRLTQSEAFAKPSSGQAALWPTLAAAANTTAARPMSRIEVRDAQGNPQRTIASTAEALQPIDSVMLNGNPGQIDVTGTATEGARTVSTYRIRPVAPHTSLGTDPGRLSIQELTVVADDTGLIRSITSTSRAQALQFPITATTVFTP